MDKDTRNAIERATQRARKLLEEDFAAQLEGDFDVHRDGEVAAKAGKHLSARQTFARERIVTAIEHKRATGMSAADTVRDYLRDAAFTTLNRYVALKMLEARDLVQECITKGEQSAGYREFCGMAPGLPLLPDSAGYRLYIESLFDELSTEVKVLFDRRDPSSVLWPKRATFEKLLEILNVTELASVWSEDETIGWVYQFFNGQDERKKMREESQAPRNSRELAVRNQFFTPRYVVQFLTDNTLGRIWYEMRGTKTALAGKCEYMVRKPGEDFAPRAKKDPRDLRVLDPACGSGHFLLYAFDLMLTIYEEAYTDSENPKSEATGKTLAEDYQSLDALRRAVPGLVLAHNLHGVDIDPRCAQIAQLALWMRAQRAYRDFGIGCAERAQIRRSNIVVAEPLVADEQITKEFVAKLGDAELGHVFVGLVEALSLAGELGLLLRVEQLVKTPQKKQGDLFAPPEQRIRATLELFFRAEGAGTNARRRLFFDDAKHGIQLLEVAETKFDVVLMNPPFGGSSKATESALSGLYPAWNRNLVCGFIARSSELCWAPGLIGTVVDRTIANKTTYEAFRRSHLLSQPEIAGMADLGWDVLDANVEVAALVLTARSTGNESAWFVDVRELGEKRGTALREALRVDTSPIFWRHARQSFRQFPSHSIVYDLPEALLSSFSRVPSLESRGLRAFTGHQLQSSRHFFCSWEMVQQTSSTDAWENEWSRLYNGGGYSRFLLPHCEAVRFGFYRDLEPRDVTDYTFVLRNRHVHFRAGVAFGVRGEVLDAHVVSEGFVFTVEGQTIPVDDAERRYYLAGFLNSSVASRLLNSFSGQHKYSGYVNCLPCPDPGSVAATEIAALSREACDIKAHWFAHRESCDWFSASVVAGTGGRDIAELTELVVARARADETRLEEILSQIDELVLQGLGSYERESKHDIEGYRRGKMPKEDLLGLLFGAEGSEKGLAKSILSIALGCCFGLHDSTVIDPRSVGKDAEGRKRADQRPHFFRARSEHSVESVLVDDLGHAADLVTRLDTLLDGLLGAPFRTDLARSLGFLDLRQYLRASQGVFSDHLRIYSDGGRTAPIYWQLATPSAGYSVWLYLHAFSKDTLFRVQNDYVAPKLAHEERRIESLTSELRDGSTAAQRKALAVQEALVEELRAFLDEVKRVAPLWKPNLDDGVIINFAPLWRLVPQNKSWQKELKSTWDALCEGKYDWSHLAMHLWPERVVPKCANDRSLAIAHGLEAVFWVEGSEGKWTARKTSTRSVDELVRERTSPAVKSALKSLLEAPVAVGAVKRTKKGKTNA